MIKFLKFSGLQYLGVGLSILINFFLAKYLIKENYGLYSLGTVVYNIIYGLNNYGLERNGLVRLNNSILSNFIEEGLAQVMIRSGLIIIISVSCIIYFIADPNFNILIWYILAGLIHSLVPKYFFDFRGMFIYESWISLIDRVVYFGILVFAFISHEFTNLYLGIAYLIGRMVYTVLCLKLLSINQENSVDWSVAISKLKELFKGNFVFWLATASNVLLLYFNQLLLGTKNGTASLAIFSFAMQFISLLRILQTQVLRWNTPMLSQKISQNILSFFDVRRVLFKAFIFSLGASILLYFSAAFVIKIYYQTFSQSIDVLAVLCFWSVFYGPGIIISFILSNRISGNIFLIISLGSALLSVFLGYVFQADAFMMSIAIASSHMLAIFFQFYLIFRSYAKNKK